LTVWDFNNGFDSYQWEEHPATGGFYLIKNNWYDQLLRDPAFADRVVKRYRELRSELWSDSRLQMLLEGYQLELGPAIKRNFAVWGYTFYEDLLNNDEQGYSRDPHSYSQAVTQMSDNMLQRLHWLDDNIDSLYDIDSAVALLTSAN